MSRAVPDRVRVSLLFAAVLGCSGADDGAVAEASASGSGAPDSGDDGSVGEDGSGDDTAGAGPCGVGGVCGAPAPEGWQGPVVRRPAVDGEEPPACADPWPDAALTFFDAYIEPGRSECSCECVSALAMLCYSGVWRHEGSADCDTYSEFVLAPAGECTPVAETTGSLTLNITGFGEPGCAPVVDADIPEPQWGQLIGGCTGAQEGDACGADGVCLPAAPDGFEVGMCVFRGGDEDCPAGSVYSHKSVVYNGVPDDTRVCVPCSCGDAAPIDCAGALDAYSNADCSGDASATVEQETCAGPLDGVASVRVAIDAPATCDKITDSQFMGSIGPGGVFTYCCAEAGS